MLRRDDTGASALFRVFSLWNCPYRMTGSAPKSGQAAGPFTGDAPGPRSWRTDMTPHTLHILWTNDNPVTAENMVFMYATNSLRKKWWENVHIIIWGVNAKLVVESEKLQELIRIFQAEGGQVSACKRCAENLGVLEKLEAIGDIDILYIGEQFTKILKSGETVLSV